MKQVKTDALEINANTEKSYTELPNRLGLPLWVMHISKWRRRSRDQPKNHYYAGYAFLNEVL